MQAKEEQSPASHSLLLEAENCVARAAELVRRSEDRAKSVAELELAAKFLSQETEIAKTDTAALRRLEALRDQLILVQATAKHAYALHVGLDQLDPGSIIGYGRSGLERAL